MDKRFISYEGLPIKSGGAHKINNGSGPRTYYLLLGFIEKLTNNPDPECILELNVSDKKVGLKATILYLIRNFGLPVWSQTNYLSTSEFVWKFYVRKKHINKALDIENKFANVTLSAMWRFKFINPETGKLLHDQDSIPVVDNRIHNSQIYLRLSKDITVSLWFTLPFADLNDEAVEYIKLLKVSLPVHVSNNHWKIWKFSKDHLTSRKLNISITDAE
ncbi:hypothetical protein GCM10023149_10040 [Mucilaginibacter gynuensis]|uniref:Uncharacterized protein n=1 Tax=Mucilaginibacter gynuensis TaxID=1302236 RepID=A0ABP8FZ64_9SPHI